jgi:hypothetical protein
MKILILAQGDPIGLDLFKKLVDARYGMSPPAMDALRVTFEGRSQARLGPLPLWARVKATATYQFPFQMKWEFKIKMLRIFNTSFATSFDGEAVYEKQRLEIKRTSDEVEVDSARRRVWAETVFFISPLIADHQVRLEGVSSSSFRALAPGWPEIATEVHLREDHTVDHVDIERIDPVDNQRKIQRLRPVGELINIDGLILPQKLQRCWYDDMFMELVPVSVEMNPRLTDDEFVLKSENLLEGLDDEE